MSAVADRGCRGPIACPSEEILDEWVVDHGGTWAERQGGMLCLGSALASCSAEVLAAVRSNCEAAVSKGLADENLPVQAAAVGTMAALGLAALRHGDDATMPMDTLAELLGSGVTEVRVAALTGVITIGKGLMADADADDALESTAGAEKLAKYVVALGEPIFKATKERNYTVRDLAVKSLAWLMQVRAMMHCPSQLAKCSYTRDRALTHSLTHSLTDSLTHSLTHSPTHSLTHSLTDSLTHSLALSPPHPFHTHTHTHTRRFLHCSSACGSARRTASNDRLWLTLHSSSRLK